LAKALGVMSLSISLDDTLSTPVVALALLFGFAERLFEGFSSSLADRAGSLKSG